MSGDITLAIDFGTSNSLVGAHRDGKRIEALPLDSFAADPTLMRTLLYFENRDQVYYGSETLVRYLENEMEGRLFRSFKTHLPNRSYSGTMIDGRVFTLEDLVGSFLHELKIRAEKALGAKADRAVIGRPARYSLDTGVDELAIKRMRNAATVAGFKEVEFVPEPLAAAFDYRRQLTSEKIVLIGDFGGGTSDFSLMRMGPYKYEKDHVLGLEGCPLAGDALDSLFMSQRLSEFFGAKAKYKMQMGSNWLTMPISITEKLNQPSQIVHLKEKNTYEFIREVRKGALGDREKRAIDRLFVLIEDNQIFSFFEQIEKTKRGLSSGEESEFTFDYPDLEMGTVFKRNEFEEWARPATEKIFAAMDQCLNQAGLTDDQIDLISLTGGSSQVPLIRHEFERRFGKEKLQTKSHFHSVLSGLIESAGFQNTIS